MESFEVTSLHTNVSNECALEAHHTSVNMHGLTVSQVMELLKECLQCNIFRWAGEYYKQISGLAMSQRLAPVLAVAFMSKVEGPVLERMPSIYCRYIDDCFVICPTQLGMDTCLDLLNRQPKHIKFTRERPTENWLAFLNVQVHLSDGICRTRWYRKPTNRNIIVHCTSAHPTSMKKAVVQNPYCSRGLF
ncbi:unnamed protein product [Heligmosomoides polygyrus]|uniref:Reverse transcriptase domain-containing protein n=1 Tax=Heligmosomoides polygyrus TaxID=6339 RepID=A0A183G102_HELPZ|nr:unnamed protein product [Heligmosomoides polygyrus]